MALSLRKEVEKHGARHEATEFWGATEQGQYYAWKRQARARMGARISENGKTRVQGSL